MHTEPAAIDFGLLDRLTDQVVCSRCLKAGVRKPVTQVVSRRHVPRTLCPDCVEGEELRLHETGHVVDFLKAWLSA